MFRWLRRKILKLVYPFTKWIGKQHLPYTRKKITGKHYLEIQHRLMPGMIFLSKTYGELTNVFIPSDWSHAAIYVGGGEIVEAVGKGVRKRDVISFMLSKDELSLHTHFDKTKMDEAAGFAIRQLGKPFDYIFEGDNRAFYCIELCMDAYGYYDKKDYLTPDIVIDNKLTWPRVWRSK